MKKGIVITLLALCLLPLMRRTPKALPESLPLATGAAAAKPGSLAPVPRVPSSQPRLVQPLEPAVGVPPIPVGAPTVNSKDVSESEEAQWLVSMDDRQRDFLLNHVHLTEDRLETIQRKQIEFYDQIKHATEFANAMGLNPEDVARNLTEEHITWMENQIGVGNYALLQDLSFW